ncbi:type IX secretion system periplasmic lipoprotein PorW/SprE [Lutibacter maritimus]|uniref:Protein involved in gliding motility SprE n=1 Tax=Lutibacter maritimus TaxID=593133 RepID=A0A1I6PIB5_9FLAO|nr:tetratricopeptide repeat protein [Lutibacter maritimus]SFS39828.1 protein involved in gliding motility SprE [Lutibacter maritimus]
MNNSVKIIVAFIGMFLLVGCSTKKDAFLNRNFHSINTKYNILYNGNEAFKQGFEQLTANYEDNYWEILPIEPLKVDELALPGAKRDEDSSPQAFEKAEEKAVKAVQKHSMLIARQERNKQIDDAYLLLGKSRYYSKRFVPALEAFNYVILNYPRANLINETKIWQAKTYIRLRNEEQAIENLKTLLKSDNLNQKTIENANTAIAMAYFNLDSTQLVINHLNKAIKITPKNKVITKAMFTTNKKTVVKPVLSTKNAEQTARNLFILGQLYKHQNKIDSSNYAFNTLLKIKKAPFKYKIHAEIEKAKNVLSNQDKTTAIEVLKNLTKDRFNKNYLDELYYHIGKVEESNDPESALTNYKKSLQSSIKNNFQKELTYEAIGNLYFEKAQFVSAAAYYDSILQITKDDSSKRIFRLKRKRSNLDEVILYEDIAKRNDSILNLVAMSNDERTTFFNNYIEKLKTAEEELQKNINTGLNTTIQANNFKPVKGNWYFYNNQTVGFGEQEFRQIWGDRLLEDNWRLSNKTKMNFPGFSTQEQENTIVVNNSELLELSYYLNQIPSNKQTIDSLKINRDNAYFKLGIIYKEQFKEIDLAKEKLEKLLTFNPDPSFSLPAKYHLYKIYSEENNKKSEEFKNDIIANFPNSSFAKIILNPTNVAVLNDTNLAENEYALVFYDYKDENFDAVIEKSNEAIIKFQGDQIIPKFELLKAYAIGKKEGILAFKEALNFVAMNYPNTEEGKKALEVIETIKTKI